MDWNGGDTGLECEKANVGSIFNVREGTVSAPAPAGAEPYLEIVVQPQCKFRFRYNSEMTGKHGSVLGNSTTPFCSSTACEYPSVASNEIKTYPTVKLHNYAGAALIRCSLVCDTPPHYPHAHRLNKNSNDESSSTSATTNQCNYVNGIVSPENNHTFTFNDLNIIYTGKKSSRREILRKITELDEWDDRKLRSEPEVNDLALRMNFNKVALYFEAFKNIKNGEMQRLCPPIASQPIHHNKSTQTSELRIVRIDKYASFCTGDEEVFILVEKVDKHNIQIKFFQENDKGIEVWKSYGKFSKLDVHHQYAIVFKTPPYRSTEIDTDVDVWIQLERPSDGATSQQIRFKYKPIERLRKMPRLRTPRNGRSGGGNQSPNQEDPNVGPQGGNVQNPENGGNGPGGGVGGALAGPSSSSVRQGAANLKFPCDLVQTNTDRSSKELALNVALSLGESLHSWAETSDFNVVLQKLRHLLCLVNENGDNALHTAIMNGQEEPFVQILKALGTSSDVHSIINETNLSGLTPLAMAVLLNAETYVQELLNFKADISISNFDGDTPMHLAIKSKHINCLHLLMRSPKCYQVLNKFNYNSLTPLHLAVSEGISEAVESLCLLRANVDCQEGTFGRTPLHIAIEKGSFSCAVLLLKSAGDKELVNVQNYRGDTPLHCAVSMESPCPVLCALLLYFGADPMIENFIRKESEAGEVQRGYTVFDLVTNSEIQKVLEAGLTEWEKLLTSPSIVQSETPFDLPSLENLNIDSGIDIKEMSS